MTLDKNTREAIANAVSNNIQSAMEVYKEEWLTSTELCKHFGMFTKDWLKEYGHTIPRERLEVHDASGQLIRTSHWAYPLHRIQRWLNERNNVNIII